MIHDTPEETAKQPPEDEDAEWDGPIGEHPGGYALKDIFSRSINEPGIHCDFVTSQDQDDDTDADSEKSESPPPS